MRKLFYLLSFYPFLGFAQSSILLPDAVELPKFAANPACTATDKGRLIFNTSVNKSYYCNGSTWVDMSAGGLTLPYNGSNNVAAPNNSFSIINSASGKAIFGETQSSTGTAGTGVYGLASNTSPSVINTGVTGYNASTNVFGYGVYGYHDGQGVGVYGVVKGSGTAVRGFASNLFGATGSGIGVEGISANSVGVFGQSSTNRGVFGKSTEGTGVRAESAGGVGLYSTSSGNHAAYFTNSHSYYATIYAVNGNSSGYAGFFEGNMHVSGNETVLGSMLVKGNKGIVRSQNSTQLKIVRSGVALAANSLAVGNYIEGATLPYEAFGGTPTILVGNVTGSSTGDWHKVSVSPINITNTQCQFRITNLSNTTATFSATWHIIIIGPE